MANQTEPIALSESGLSEGPALSVEDASPSTKLRLRRRNRVHLVPSAVVALTLVAAAVAGFLVYRCASSYLNHAKTHVRMLADRPSKTVDEICGTSELTSDDGTDVSNGEGAHVPDADAENGGAEQGRRRRRSRRSSQRAKRRAVRAALGAAAGASDVTGQEQADGDASHETGDISNAAGQGQVNGGASDAAKGPSDPEGQAPANEGAPGAADAPLYLPGQGQASEVADSNAAEAPLNTAGQGQQQGSSPSEESTSSGTSAQAQEREGASGQGRAREDVGGMTDAPSEGVEQGHAQDDASNEEDASPGASRQDQEQGASGGAVASPDVEKPAEAEERASSIGGPFSDIDDPTVRSVLRRFVEYAAARPGLVGEPLPPYEVMWGRLHIRLDVQCSTSGPPLSSEELAQLRSDLVTVVKAMHNAVEKVKTEYVSGGELIVRLRGPRGRSSVKVIFEGKAPAVDSE